MATTHAVYPVDILLPEHWRQFVRYRLQRQMKISGVLVPKGFITDGATIPRFLWPLLPPVCQYFPAAVVHDYLLVSGTSWKIANRHFRQVLKELGIPRWRRALMAAGVAVYGTYKEMWQ